MSAGEDTFEEIRTAFVRGRIDSAELRDRLRALDEDTDREELWARWAEQGLFDDPIDQEGYVSFEGGQRREVDPDG